MHPIMQILTGPDRFWLSRKMRPSQFATNKNRPGTDYATKLAKHEEEQGLVDPQVATVLALQEAKNDRRKTERE